MFVNNPDLFGLGILLLGIRESLGVSRIGAWPRLFVGLKYATVVINPFSNVTGME
jgi:hypothetical protein